MKFHTLLFGFLFLSSSASAFSNSAQATSEKLGEWTLSCKSSLCYIHQSLVADNGKKAGIVASINVALMPKNMDVLSVRLGSNALKEAGIGIKIDNNKDIKAKILECNAQLCQTNIAIDEQMQKELTNGTLMQLVYLDKNSKKQITLPFGLKNYSKAYQALKNH